MGKQATLFQDDSDGYFLDEFSLSQIKLNAENIKRVITHYLNVFFVGYSKGIKESPADLKKWIGDQKQMLYDIFDNAYMKMSALAKERVEKENMTQDEYWEHKKQMDSIYLNAMGEATKTTSDILISMGKRQMFKNPYDFEKALGLPREIIDKMWTKGKPKQDTKKITTFTTKETGIKYEITSKDIKTVEQAQVRLNEALGSEGKIVLSGLAIYSRDNKGFIQKNVNLIDLMKASGIGDFSQPSKRKFTRWLMNFNGFKIWEDKDYPQYVDRFYYTVLDISRTRHAKPKGEIDDTVINELDFELFPGYNNRAELRARLVSRNITKLNPERDKNVVDGIGLIQLQIDHQRTGTNFQDDKVYIVRKRDWLISAFNLVEDDLKNRSVATKKLNRYIKKAIDTENIKCVPDKITSDPKKKYKIYGANVSYSPIK